MSFLTRLPSPLAGLLACLLAQEWVEGGLLSESPQHLEQCLNSSLARLLSVAPLSHYSSLWCVCPAISGDPGLLKPTVL